MAETSQPGRAPAVGPNGAQRDVASLSFEEALAELEQIVHGLEAGQQKLEDAILAYERGTALRRHCETKLMEVEGRVAAIVESGGTVTLRPLD
jgi:exodeoxyribonuclease VII small subunit